MEPSFYDFINANDLNNPISLVSGGSYIFLSTGLGFQKAFGQNPYTSLGFHRQKNIEDIV
jgi:hypothetical protein